MSRGTPQFGQIRPSPVRIPGAIPEAGDIAELGRTVFEAFGAATTGARAATAETVREQRVESAEDRLLVAQQAAIQDEASRMRTRVLLETKELEREFDENADLEFFGAQELFARGNDGTKRDFLAKHQWADPRNQSRIEGFYGRQLATTDWFRAQQRITDFYTNEANADKSLRVTELMAEFLEERQDLPAGASIAYQKQFMGQVGNFIFQQEAARANARSKEVRQQRNRNNLAQAGLYFMGKGDLGDFAQVVTDGIELVEGEEGLDLVEDQMAQAAGLALAKLIGVIPNSELEPLIADLPTKVLESAEVKFARTEMRLAERQADQKAITQEASDVTALSTRFTEANDIRSLVMLKPRAARIPGAQGRQVRALLESRITQLDDNRNRQINLMEKGANVSISDISSVPEDMLFETRNFERLSHTLRETAEVDRNEAFALVASEKNGVIGEMLIRAKRPELPGLVNVLNRAQTPNLLGDAVERKNQFVQKSGVLSSLAEAAPTDEAVARYGDRFIHHFLDLQTRPIGPIGDPEQAAKMASAMVKADLETDFVKLRPLLGRPVYGRANLFKVGNLREGKRAGVSSVQMGLLALGLEARRQGGGISPNIAAAFEHKGKTYVPATGGGRAGAFLEWDSGKRERKIIRPLDRGFGELQQRLADTTESADLVTNSDVRWRASYGTRFVSEFDQAYFSSDSTSGIGGWIRDEAERRWFDNTGQLPQTDIEGLEGRELEQVQLQRELFRTIMDQVATEHGWGGLDRVQPAAASQFGDFLSGLDTSALRALELIRQPKAPEDNTQLAAPATASVTQ